MTGRQALDKVLNTIRSYVHTHHKNPECLVLGWELSIDLCKCNQTEIGQMAAETMKFGNKAFEKHGVFGIPVKIDRKNFTSDVEALPKQKK